jgi:proton glutamate symport protein
MPFSGIGRVPDAARVLIGLAAGIAIGLAVAGTTRPVLLLAVTASETIGTLWVNAIRMTVVPLVAALLISRIAGTSGSAGRVGAKAFAFFVLLAAAGAVFAAIVAPPIIDALPLDPDTLERVRATAVAPQSDIPPFRDWLTALVPPNPLKAAADGALLPFVVFIVCFALALSRTDEQSRVTIVRFFDAITQTMFVLIGWIIRLSPLGVCALGVSLAARGGVGVTSALGLYVATVAALLATATLLLYPLVAAVGGVSLIRFAQACVPFQAIAFSTRSSIASLPVLIDRAEHELGINADVSGIVLPIAVSIFKFGMPILRLTGACFIARLFGIPLGWVDVLALAAAVIAASFYTPGVPSGSIFILAPIFEALGLPVEGIGLLLAVDLVPDMFVTVANTTADLAVTTLLSTADRSAINRLTTV